MDVLHEMVCGLDVHKDSIVACMLLSTPGGELRCEVQMFGTKYDDLLLLADWLCKNGKPLTAMESTGTYWAPIYNLLVDKDISCMVVNSQYARNVPGRKTDMNDAHWIAQLTMYGLLRPSVVPEQQLQELRYFTRAYACIVQDRAQAVNRVEKLMQRNGFKLSSVLEDVVGKTGRAILNHLAKHGCVTVAVVEKYRSANCKRSVDEIAAAMRGRLSESMCWMLNFELAQIDHYDAELNRLYEQIKSLLAPCKDELSLLCSIPGINELSAMQILAEIGANMAVFNSGTQLAAWAGLSPGNCESAGKKSPRTSSTATDTLSAC